MLRGGRWPGSGDRARRPASRRGTEESRRSVVQFAQHLVEGALGFEADAGYLGEPDLAVGDDGVIGEPAGGLELARVGLVAAELERCGDVQRELMSAVGDAAARGPAVFAQHLLDAKVFG